ncbi:hypothetical protein HYH02_002128 [Chlamydomonas schloesseri]|uniref:Uncharacterized protein n=1 Tax=Chlamydomonas schloesseri TaxID=2026947 RepID=A0A835WUF7_9CHLO|nr:hypothetical protein HYH02_002128 [Chlamydomonas schloesseri]|eukprot:KAG2453925.1 hypothetical protein HYH02_002128 [Chlamydomonas schloesseri]
MEPGPPPAPALESLPCCALAELQPPPVPGVEDWAASDAWLERAVESAKHQVSNLFAYFRLNKRDDQTVLVMSIKDNFLAATFPLPRRRDVARSSLAAAAAAPYEAGAAAAGDDGSSASGGEDGGGESEAHARNRSLALQTTYLYYGVLLHALRKLYPMTLPPGMNASSRFAKPSVAAGDVPKVSHLLSIPVFHTSLLTVAAMITRAVADRDPSCLGATPDLFLRIPQAAGFAPNMMALWNAARWYQEAFVTMPLTLPNTGGDSGAASSQACAGADAQLLPALPGRFVLGRLMRVCEERGVLAEGSTVYCILTEGAAGGYTEGDSALLNVFLQSYARRATATVERMAAVALQQLTAAARAAGEAPHPHQHLLPDLAAELMDQVMCTRLELCFNQHVSVLAACCLYSVAKALKLRLPFSSITRAFLAYLPDHPPDLFDRQVELQPAGVSGGGGAGSAGGGAAARSLAARAAAAASVAGDDGRVLVERPAVMGDIRAFYNQSFLPAMEGTVRSLVRSRTMGTASIAAAGPIPPMPSYSAVPAASVAAQAAADTAAARQPPRDGHVGATEAAPQGGESVALATRAATAAVAEPSTAPLAVSAPAGFAFPALAAAAPSRGGEGQGPAPVPQGGGAVDLGLRAVTELAADANEAADVAEAGRAGVTSTPNSGAQQQGSEAHSVASLREWEHGPVQQQAPAASVATTTARDRLPQRATRRTTAAAAATTAAGTRTGPSRPALSVLPDEEEEGGEDAAAADGESGAEHRGASAGMEDGTAARGGGGAHNQRYGRTSGAARTAAKPGGLGILRLLRPPSANAAPPAAVAAEGAGGKPKLPGQRKQVDPAAAAANDGAPEGAVSVSNLLPRPPRPAASPRAAPTPAAFISVHPQQQQDASGIIGGTGSVNGDKENLRVVGAGKKPDEYGFEDADGTAAAATTATSVFAAGGAGGRRRASSYR